MTSPRLMKGDFVVLSPDKKATIEHSDSGLYERLDEKYGGFAGHELISCHEFTTDWPSWEVHPHGDEIVILLSGSTTFQLQLESDITTVDLSEQGQYVVVPQGVWHTAKTREFAKLLFITPGQNTQNRARSQS